MASKIYGETYKVLTGIAHDKKGVHSAGDIVKLDKPWDVQWLIDIGAVELTEDPTPAVSRKNEVNDGDGED